MSFTQKELEHVAILAHLELSDDEKKDYLSHLGKVLKHVDKLNELDLDNLAPTIHTDDKSTHRREDVVSRPFPVDLHTNAPKTDGNCFSVPKILT